MKTTEKTRFAVVGVGWIGKRHAAMISDNADAELVAVADIRPKSDTDFAHEVPYYSDLDTMLRAEHFDVLCICTPNNLHAPMAMKALKAGKHVVVEKPFALSLEDAKRVAAEAEKMQKKIFAVAQNRYSPPIAWLKEMVESERLGQIYNVQINCYWNRDERYYTGLNWHGTHKADGGVLFTQFWHYIDVMAWLFGDINDVHTLMHNYAHKRNTQLNEDSGAAQFRFENGAIGSFNFSTAVWQTNLESTIIIVAENGTIKIGGQYMNEVTYCNVKNYTMPELSPSMPANDYGTHKGSAANHCYVIENVVETLRGRAAATSSELDATLTLHVVEQLYGKKRQSDINDQKW